MEHLSGLKDELESELDRGVLFGLDVEEPEVQVRCSGCSGFTPIVPPQGLSRPTAPPRAQVPALTRSLTLTRDRSAALRRVFEVARSGDGSAESRSPHASGKRSPVSPKRPAPDELASPSSPRPDQNQPE